MPSLHWLVTGMRLTATETITETKMNQSLFIATDNISDKNPLQLNRACK